MTHLQRVAAGSACSHADCKNFARSGKDTCRWHDPVVLELRREADEARARVLRAAGAA